MSGDEVWSRHYLEPVLDYPELIPGPVTIPPETRGMLRPLTQLLSLYPGAQEWAKTWAHLVCRARL